MKRILILAFLLMTIWVSGAGQGPLDSLLRLLRAHNAEDTVRINLLNTLSFEYSFSNPDSGLQMAEQAIQLSKKIGNQIKLASAYSTKGVNYAAKGNDSAALTLYQQALLIHEELDNKAGIARVLNNIAIVEVRLSNYALALEYHSKSFNTFETMGDRYQMANSLNNTGVVYLYLADYARALEYYLKALFIFEQLNIDAGVANNLSNIGIIYKNLGNHAQALQFHQRALDLYIKTNNLQGEANTWGNMGVVYDQLGNPVKALDCYQKALRINNRLGNQIRIASDLTNIGVSHHALLDYSRAKEYYEKALLIYENVNEKNSIVTVLNQLGKLYSEVPDSALSVLGIKRSDRSAKALQYLTTSLKIAEETGTADRQSETWDILSSVYEKQGRFDKALEAYKFHIVFRDSIHNVETEKQVIRKEMGFEIEKKAALSAEEVSRERVIRNVIAAASLALLIAIAITAVFYKRKIDADKMKKIAESNAEISETRMKVLRLQMNPHFIFNSLNSISDYINRNSVVEADQFLTRFANLMRITLENSEQTVVTLAEDLEALELYMQLESYRLENKFTYEFIIDQNIDTENTLIPPLILQPFIENSILHGISGKKGDGKISIRILLAGNQLCCEVEDNGIGTATLHTRTNPVTHKKSLGQSITRSRIEMFNKSQDLDETVKIIDTGHGTKAIIVLALQLKF